MNRLYLVVYAAQLVDKEVQDFLDGLPTVAFWFKNLPNSIFVATTLSSTALYNKLEGKFGEHSMFVTEVNKDRYFGRLAKDHWQYFDQYAK